MKNAPSQQDLANGLEDIVIEYSDEEIPVEWLTPLKLDRPRFNLKRLSPGSRALKRTVDVTASLLAIVILAPVALLISLLIRITSRGPAIFRQERVGINRRWSLGDRRSEPRSGEEQDRRQVPSFGRPFTMYKFRTMVVDAEKDGARLAEANDPRVTPVGRFLRKTRLDEILQFINVLMGDMSLVGPRPERPEFVQALSGKIPGYLDRLGLKPGITGLAQILNGYDEDLESVRRKVSLDLLYLQNASLWNDFKILLRTVRVVLKGSGAR